MRLRLAGTLSLLSLLFFVLPLQPAQAEEIPITIDGYQLTVDQPPVIENGRTLVPLRPIFEGLGAEVTWFPSTQSISGSLDSSYIYLEINNTTATVNNKNITIDVPPRIINSRTMVPLRFISESLGATVTWNDATRSISIDSNDNYAKIKHIDYKGLLPINVNILPPDSIGTIYVEGQFKNITSYPITGYSLSFIDKSNAEKNFLSEYTTVLSGENSPKFNTFGPASRNKSDIEYQKLSLALETSTGKFYVDYDYKLNKITQILKMRA